MRLKEIRESMKLSQKAFGTLLGLSQGTYQKYESGLVSTPQEILEQLADKMGINLHWLITGIGPMHIGGEQVEEESSRAHARDVNIKKSGLKDSVEVPMTSLRLSAGPGQEWSDAELTGEVLYIPKRVARRYPGNSDFAGAQVVGDSMEPTLHDGEPVVYVRGFVQGDGIYVLAVNGELLVKRLQFDGISGKLHIISDNPRYRQLEIPLEGLDNVRILGKVVIWVHGEV